MLFFILSAASTVFVFALTPRDLIKLKEAGVPEDVITLMLNSGYDNADEVISLKKAGFGPGTIKAFIVSNGGARSGANSTEKGEEVYSTKGLEDLQPPYQNYPGYWDTLPNTRLFIVPGINGNQGQGQGNTNK